MQVIITEKPSVARDYIKILKIAEKGKNDGYVEGTSAIDGRDYCVTWAVGHLVTLSYPEVYDEKLKKWNLEQLPFLPEEYIYETLSSTKKQFNVIKKLYNSPSTERIYYAGDSGREGIYIQMLIRQMAGVKKGVDERVVWINSQTEAEILRGVKEAKPLTDYKNLSDSAYARAIEDFAIGINFSRALSCKFGYQYNKEIESTSYKPIAVGRVMTCVLGMIVEREREISNFKEVIFYKPEALCGSFKARWKAVEGTPHFNAADMYNNDGFLSYQNAINFTDELKKNPELKIDKAETKEEKKQPPLLYNLAEIQNDCSRLFKLSPDETLANIQELYEKKLVTYPRTDARVLSSAVAKEISVNLNGLLKGGYLKNKIQYIIDNNSYMGLEKTKYVDDSKITDHYAIIPTGETANGLSEPLKSVYELIVKRFLSIFYPAAVYEKTEIELTHKTGEKFFASSRNLKSKGYLEVIGTEEEKADSKLNGIKAGNVINTEYTVVEGRTSPPKRYTSGSIILAMENAGQLIEDEELRAQIKNCGIGTSATRAEVIKKLCKNEYIELNKKTQMLKPALAGEKLYDIVSDNISAMLNPKMTASWEKGLGQINDGVIGKKSYLQKMNGYIETTIAEIKSKKSMERSDEPVEIIGICPYCGKNVVTTSKGFKCEDYGKEDGKCSLYIGQIAGKSLTREQVVKILTNGKTDVISGFKSKSGKKFSASIAIDKKEKKLVFEFPERVTEATEFDCPKCGKKLSKDDYSLSCSCGFKTSHVIAKKKLNKNEIIALLAGRTGIIEGFTSKSGKKFAATLILENNGKVSFNFPK